MTTLPYERPNRRIRLFRVAAFAGVAAPFVWAAAVGLELVHANLGHSIISRPERFFSDSAWHWPIVALVAITVACQLTAAIAAAAAVPRRRIAMLAGIALVPALLSRLAMALLLPSDPGGYTVSAAAAAAADLLLVGVPLGLIWAATAAPRRGPGLAWLTHLVAIAMVFIAVWATAWAARTSADQPQLLAVEPVELLTSLWAAAIGAWLLGWPARLRPNLRWPSIKAPGRLVSAGVAGVAIAAVVFSTASFVDAYEPASAQLAGRTQVERIHADAVDRTYRVYRPTNETAAPGLVILLHGSFGDGFQIESDTGFDSQADRLGWIAVYPDGVADGWDAFGSTDKWGKHPGADDVAFISALIDHFEATDGVDPHRVYVAGMSRGGMMTYRLGCALSGRLAAIAPVSGNMATTSGSADVPCSLAAPVSVLAIHGTADRTIPIDGGRVDIVYSPMADVITRWRSMDGCGPQATSTLDGPSTTTSWSCSGGSVVEQRIVAGGYHQWPWVSGRLASAGGSPDSFDASRLIADFFVAHPRAPAGS
jgi:polyhydroxybutyrate depolymerase